MTHDSALSHRIRRFVGRDPRESHRAASPLELLFDLTFVVAFAQTASQTAHLLELGHVLPAMWGFGIATFAITWAWINCTWLASAFDNDDIVFRVATFVEMVGVLLLALGMPALFASIDEGEHLDNGLLVAGYVVMRLATVFLWLRAARDNPGKRHVCLAYAIMVSAIQVLWIVMIFINPPLNVALALGVALFALEMAAPIVAERFDGGTPWHPHHIAERYGLMLIISLGEVVVGAILIVSAVVEVMGGWTLEAALLAGAGTALAFGMWWIYFTLPSAQVLSHHRDRSFPWGYGHILIYGSIILVGAGLHVAALVIEGVAHVDAGFAVLSVAIPVFAYITVVFVLYSLLLGTFDPFHILLYVGSAAVVTASVIAVQAGVSVGWSLVILSLAPVVTVVGFETVGHHHQRAALDALVREAEKGGQS